MIIFVSVSCSITSQSAARSVISCGLAWRKSDGNLHLHGGAGSEWARQGHGAPLGVM